MKSPAFKTFSSRRGFTVTEVMISMTITALFIGMLLTTFTMGLKTMYKDRQRLITNATLRNFTAQIAKETVDSTEFYVFPTYEKFDGSVDFVNDISALAADSFDTYLAEGDCLLLVTRTSLADNAPVKEFKICYRVVKGDTSGNMTQTNVKEVAPVRFYERDLGDSNTTSLQDLVNAVNLKATPAYAGTRVLASSARGRAIPGTSNYHPIFSTESATTTPTNESVSINVELINGTTTYNMLSTSSFNYTISPRR
ncbi:PulJ/GspJ family protein [Oleiharenicola lentus]|uniref:PulJ/GspJ family protein n=1 Tax=Oleiharenicola lentus TaxID=2508720 RepID=UPI003F6642D1